MTKPLSYTLVISGPAYGSQNASSAYLFAQALLKRGHKIERLFFYQDAVLNASSLHQPANDEFDLHKAWCELAAQHNLQLEVCVAAALRRGLIDEEEAQQAGLQQYNVQAPFIFTGLGQLAQALLSADRVLQF